MIAWALSCAVLGDWTISEEVEADCENTGYIEPDKSYNMGQLAFDILYDRLKG